MTPSDRSRPRRWGAALEPFLSLQIQWRDSLFVRRLGLTPSASNRILQYPAGALERLRRVLRAEYQDRTFARFTRLHPRHYSVGGRGYQTVAGGSPEERRQRYEGQHSRLEHFLDEFHDLLDCVDGDSFLDLGCGTGQNLRMLAARFPASSITGYDLNADAVALVQECEEHPGVRVGLGDLIDPEFRRRTLSEPVDHIVLSHVFSLIFGPSADDTVSLRRDIVDDLVAACRKDIVIVDTFGSPGLPVISIEQRQRATVSDNVMDYFAGHASGRVVMAQSDRTRAVIFIKRRDRQLGD